MTITAQTPRSGPEAGDGSTVAFTYGFLIEADTELVVTVRNTSTEVLTTKTLTTDYTVTGAGNVAGGTVTFATAPTPTEEVAFTRSVPLTQDLDLQNRGVVSPSLLEQKYDDLYRISQDQGEAIGRAVKADVFNVVDQDQLALYLNTLAGISGEIATVASLETAIGTVNTNAADIATVAGISADVSSVAAIDTNVTTVAGNTANVTTVAGISANVTTVAGIASDVTTVSGINAAVTTVAADGTDIGLVAGNIASVNTVAGISSDVSAVSAVQANVTTVAGISADVTTVAADQIDIGLVAGNSANINTVAGISANVTTVAGISADVTTVAADGADIGVVSGISADVTTVAGNIANINQVAADTIPINAASANASAAAVSAAEALASELAAAATAAGLTGLDLSAIDTSILDTAVDVFVYDTSKDSDGGAWRKRTQGTSWYQETLNTATRGSRREFPSVAVIVSEASVLTIYDGDDPALPMWMVFNADTSKVARPSSSLSALNGVLLSAGTNLALVNYISDEVALYGTSGFFFGANNGRTGVIERNVGLAWNSNTGDGIVNATTQDVAMTVLPDAPIDPATGLPVPTIAVATDGGISVVTDSGAVYDSAYTNTAGSISFTDDNGLLFALHGAASGQNLFLAEPDVFVSDGWASTIIAGNTGINGFPILSTTANDSLFSGGLSQIAQAGGLSKILWNSTENESLLNYTTSSYNTGWMNGDIKGAFLSDTDATDLVDTEAVTNGTFDTDTVWIKTGFSISGGVATSDGVTGTPVLQETPFPTVEGKVYKVSVTVTTSGVQTLYIRLNSLGNLHTELINTTTKTVTVYLTDDGNTASGLQVLFTGGELGPITVDNISVQLADADRSVNANPLNINGTITRTAVATGAELVAYSGFSASNYLEQPYNADLDFGTGDFCVMGWITPVGTGFHSLLERAYYNGSYASPYIGLRWSNGAVLFIRSDDGTTYDQIVTAAVAPSGSSHHIVALRRGTNFFVYVDGNEIASQASVNATGSLSNTSATLRLGLRADGTTPLNSGSLALWRISATAPTAAQIAKIYEDEKYLFQENAAATLYGTSDAVTALAHDSDTDLLHVGTSAGRSVFDGLRRVSNTTTAVGTAISASNGLVVEE